MGCKDGEWVSFSVSTEGPFRKQSRRVVQGLVWEAFRLIFLPAACFGRMANGRIQRGDLPLLRYGNEHHCNTELASSASSILRISWPAVLKVVVQTQLIEAARYLQPQGSGGRTPFRAQPPGSEVT